MSKAIQILRHVAQNKSLLTSPLTKFYANEVDERTSEVLHALMAADDQQIDFALLITSDADVSTTTKEVSPEPVIEEAITGELVNDDDLIEDAPVTIDEKMEEFDSRLDDRLRDLHDDETVSEARSDEMSGLVDGLDDKPQKREISPETEAILQETIDIVERDKVEEPEPDDELSALIAELDQMDKSSIKEPEIIEEAQVSDETEDEDDLDLDSLLDDLEG